MAGLPSASLLGVFIFIFPFNPFVMSESQILADQSSLFYQKVRLLCVLPCLTFSSNPTNDTDITRAQEFIVLAWIRAGVQHAKDFFQRAFARSLVRPGFPVPKADLKPP